MYHVWTHANGNENLFRTDDNYNYFLEKYIYHIHPVVETFAYCLMPNHLHLMVRIRNEYEVLEFLREKKNNQSLQGFGTLETFQRLLVNSFLIFLMDILKLTTKDTIEWAVSLFQTSGVSRLIPTSTSQG